jgi:hypothetical protein
MLLSAELISAPIEPGAPNRALALRNTALSRRKQGFDSPRERQVFQGLARKFTPARSRFFNFSPTAFKAIDLLRAQYASLP